MATMTRVTSFDEKIVRQGPVFCEGEAIPMKHGKRLTASQMIRAKCLDCSNGSCKEVRYCPVEACPLWPRRMGYLEHDLDYQEPEMEICELQVEPHEEHNLGAIGEADGRTAELCGTSVDAGTL